MIAATAQDLWADHLRREHGEMVSGPDLRRYLGYRTADGFAKAVKRGKVAVPVFKLAGRLYWFCWVSDLAKWLGDRQAPVPHPGAAQ